MPNTEFKAIDLTTATVSEPSTVQLSPNTVMTHNPQRDVGTGQDGVCASSARVLGMWGMGGADTFHVPASGAPVVQVGPHDFPDRDVLRNGGSIFANRLTPGNFVRARIYFIGGGNTQFEDPANTWNPGGPFGAIQVTHSWTTGATTDGPHSEEYVLGSSILLNAQIPMVEAGFWHQFSFIEVGPYRPDDINIPATGVDWVEDVELEFQIELRGAPRIHSVVLYEDPLRAIYDHEDDGPHAINGQRMYEVPQTQPPQIEAADGATFDENGFGSFRMLNTAERQDDAVGPAMFSLVAWNEDTQDDDTDVTPIVVTSTTLVDILEQTASTYDRDRAGLITAAAHAQVHYLSEDLLILGGEAVVVPGRAVLEARITGGATTATVRVQSGEFEWIDFTVTSGTFTLLEMTGYFESQVTPDHEFATLQVFAEVDAGTVEIRSVSATFGE